MRIKKESFTIFLKGFAMGFVDIIPGVSGGTIALITGIYQRIIDGISSIDVKMPLYFIKDFRKFKKSFFDIDFNLFIPLLSGILLAILLMAHIMSFLLEKHNVITNSFFLGLILASALILILKLRSFNFYNLVTFLAGFILAYLISTSKTILLGHSYLITFFSGIVAICAMILPGISGSFVLYLMNQYKFMLEAVKNYDILTLILFALGALIGIIGFSKLLRIVLKRYHTETLYFLIGLMLGALALPWGVISKNMAIPLIYKFISATAGFILIMIFHFLTKK